MPTYDRAYQQAFIFGQRAERGILVYLHGCDGIRGRDLEQWRFPWRDMVELFLSRGLLFVGPDSFADSRPPASCGPPWFAKDQIYSIRAEQTQQALRALRREYPGAKIVIWGHSEGSGVANLVDERVDGIITTGYQCGFRSTGRTYIRRDVPLLALMGTADRYIEESLRTAPSSSIQGICDMVFSGARDWKFVVVEGMGHAPDVGRPEVRDALLSFLATVLK